MTFRGPFTQTCLAFWRPMWMRYRREYIYSVIACVTAIVAAQLVAHFGDGIQSSPSAQVTKSTVFLYIVAGLQFVACYALSSKIGLRADGSSGTSFTGPSLTLPVTTRNLVLAPMAVAVGSVTGFWVIFWLFGILPCGAQVPFLMPILLLALVITASQSSAWMIRSRAGLGCLFLLISLAAPFPAFLVFANHIPLIVPNIGFAALIWFGVKSAEVRHPGRVDPMRRGI